MKNVIYLLTIFLVTQSCDLQKDSDFVPLVPENTPFIVGILEATDDTVHHYPEVYVGTVSNPEGFEAKPVWTTPGIWWPVTNALVTRPVTRNDLKRTADIKAKVKIKGPLETPQVTTVQFKHEGKGVYGDIHYELPLIGGKTYRLSVEMGDGRFYTATTRIPELFKLNVPDSVMIELKLDRYTNGVNYEEDKESVSFPFSIDPKVGYVTIQTNSEYDHYNFNVQKGAFIFSDRGNYLRGGAAYGLYDASDFPEKHSISVGWGESGDDPLRNSEYWWLSVSQFNVPTSRFYYTVFRTMSGEPGGRWDRQDQERVNARLERDTTFLFDISNILKVNENGQVLPESQADAIGVFGAYSAAYRNLTVIPQRSWDPDTLNWGNQGN